MRFWILQYIFMSDKETFYKKTLELKKKFCVFMKYSLKQSLIFNETMYNMKIFHVIGIYRFNTIRELEKPDWGKHSHYTPFTELQFLVFIKNHKRKIFKSKTLICDIKIRPNINYTTEKSKWKMSIQTHCLF